MLRIGFVGIGMMFVGVVFVLTGIVVGFGSQSMGLMIGQAKYDLSTVPMAFLFAPLGLLLFVGGVLALRHSQPRIVVGALLASTVLGAGFLAYTGHPEWTIQGLIAIVLVASARSEFRSAAPVR